MRRNEEMIPEDIKNTDNEKQSNQKTRVLKLPPSVTEKKNH